MKNVLLIIAIFLLIAGCTKTDDELLIGSWELSHVEVNSSGTVYEYPDDLIPKIYIEITDSGHVCLSGFCNSGSATWSMEKKTIRFDDVTLTEMGCLGNNWESYLYELYYVTEYKLESDTLILYTDSDHSLHFQRME